MVMEMSKTYQYRKVMKPLLERKRRARINKCLDDLKDLMVECLQQEGEHVTRLEKADILELTVEHMRKLKQRGALSLQAQSTAHVESFRSGYVHAADQISQVLLQQQQADEIGSKIMKFLSARLIEMQHQLLRTSIVAPVVPPPPQPPPPNMDYANLSRSSSSSSSGSSFSPASFHYKPFAPASAKDSDLIDVTTVDHSSSSSSSSSSASSSAGDTASVISVDSTCSSESVWRPW